MSDSKKTEKNCDTCDRPLTKSNPTIKDENGEEYYNARAGRYDKRTRCVGCYFSKTNFYAGRIPQIEPTFIEKPVPTKQFKCKRLVGIEWEYSAYKKNTAEGKVSAMKKLLAWATKENAGNHEDGSCMAEVVTAPMGGDNIKKQVTSLGKLINSNFKVDEKVCGLHVHVDARDIDKDGMERLLVLYGKIEPSLYIIAGISREKSTYCRPLKNNKPSNQHYDALNISNWTRKDKKKMTVEFRMQKGTNDANHVTHWAQLCASVVDFAVKSKKADLDKLKGTGMQILKEIYPGGAEWMLECLLKYRKEVKVKKRTISFKEGKSTWIVAKPVTTVQYHCGARLGVTSRFCPRCGRNVTAPVASSSFINSVYDDD